MDDKEFTDRITDAAVVGISITDYRMKKISQIESESLPLLVFLITDIG